MVNISKVNCLQNAIPLVADHVREITDQLSTPLSSVDVSLFMNFIESKKTALKHVDQDLKDAKRRISVAKGPRPKKSNAQEEASDSDGDGSDAWDPSSRACLVWLRFGLKKHI